MTAKIATLTLADLEEGQSAEFEAEISQDDIDRFASVSGDISPLHMSTDFACSRGFHRRVVHGALLGGLVSRLVGVYLPGRDCLLHSMQMKFLAPTYAGTRVRVTGTVDQLSEAANAMVVKVSIIDTQTEVVLATSTVRIGFTKEKRDV